VGVSVVLLPSVAPLSVAPVTVEVEVGPDAVVSALESSLVAPPPESPQATTSTVMSVGPGDEPS
jgi:hypothetical protein